MAKKVLSSLIITDEGYMYENGIKLLHNNDELTQ